MNTNEKRKSPRVDALNLSYICLDEDQQVIKQGMGRTLNVSESGILLETYFPIETAHTVVLSIGFKDCLVDVKGRPAHIRSTGPDVYEIGVEFLDLDETARHAVKDYLDSLGK
jgi:PilZ domain